MEWFAVETRDTMTSARSPSKDATFLLRWPFACEGSVRPKRVLSIVIEIGRHRHLNVYEEIASAPPLKSWHTPLPNAIHRLWLCAWWNLEQFGVAIASFQALQHRAAHMQSEIELCRSVLLQTLSTVDDAPEQLPLLASLAKAKLNELVKLVTNEAVQMHGGIGVTDELEIGFFLKRARIAIQVFGDTGFHKDRYATLCGY